MLEGVIMSSVKCLFVEFEKLASDDKKEFLCLIEIMSTRTNTIRFTQEAEKVISLMKNYVLTAKGQIS